MFIEHMDMHGLTLARDIIVRPAVHRAKRPLDIDEQGQELERLDQIDNSIVCL